MAVLVMHARWNAVSAQQLHLLQDLVEQERSAEGCCSFTSRRDGSSVLLTAVWESEGSMLAFTLGSLARTCTAALLDEPQVAMFALPAPFAAAYRRPVPVPAPRTTATPASVVDGPPVTAAPATA